MFNTISLLQLSSPLTSGGKHILYETNLSGSCNSHIGQGVRYNAEKKQVGNYYSTPVWSFRCKCHLCQSWFEIRTDPQVSITFDGLNSTHATLLNQVRGSSSKSGEQRRRTELLFMVRKI